MSKLVAIAKCRIMLPPDASGGQHRASYGEVLVIDLANDDGSMNALLDKGLLEAVVPEPLPERAKPEKHRRRAASVVTPPPPLVEGQEWPYATRPVEDGEG